MSALRQLFILNVVCSLVVLFYAFCPGGVLEYAAADTDEVCRTVAQESVGGFHICYAAGEHDGDRDGLFYRPAEVFKVSSLCHKLGHSKLAQPARYTEYVRSALGEPLCCEYAGLGSNAAGHVVTRSEADGYREVCPDCGSDRCQHLAEKTQTVFSAAAVGIAAFICQRGIELVKQIRVRRVYFNAVEACLFAFRMCYIYVMPMNCHTGMLAASATMHKHKYTAQYFARLPSFAILPPVE